MWFKSETAEGYFTPAGAESFELWLDDRVMLESEGDEKVQQVLCRGIDSYLTEARHALREGKKITQAKMKLRQGDNDWAFTLDAAWLNFRSLKTPKVMADLQEDPEGLFFERLQLTKKVVELMEALFIDFMKIRISERWVAEEIPAFRTWLKKSLEQ